MKACILILSLFVSCQLPYIDVIHPDQVFTKPIETDTIIVEDDTITLPIVADTCFQLVEIDTPQFIVVSTYFFNGMPLNPVWHWQGNSFQSTDLIEVMKNFYPQYEYAYYDNNGAVSVIVTGTTDNTIFQGKIYTTDLIGQVALLTSFGQSFYFYGALTFDEAMVYAAKYPSVVSFHYTNTDWTQEQNNQYARTILHPELCKQGGFRSDFRAALGIVPTVIDSFDLFEWQYVLTLNDQLLKA